MKQSDKNQDRIFREIRKTVEQIENKSLYDAVLHSARRSPNAPALLYKGKTVSYRTFLHNVDRLADALRKSGVKSGDIVTVCLPNIPKTAYLIYAINQIGAISYLRHALSPPDEMLRGLDKTNSRVLFALDTAVPALEAECRARKIRLISCCPADELGCFSRMVYRSRKALRRLLKTDGIVVDYRSFVCTATVGSAETHAKNGHETRDFYDRNDSSKTAVLLDSGGTCGIPKTVALSARSINLLGAAGRDILGKSLLDNCGMMSPLPVFHCFGLTMGLHAILVLGGYSVLMPRFSKKEAIRYLKQRKIHYMIGVPAVYDALVSVPTFAGKLLDGVDAAFVGGDYLQNSTKCEFDARMQAAGARARLFEGYGLSETLSVACVNTHAANKHGSVGKPLRGVEIRAVMTESASAFLKGKDFGDTLQSGVSVGELCISGEILMNGYFDDDAATKTAFFAAKDGTRLLATGDLGYVDSEGFVHFLARMKNVIKVSGESIFPSEIENLVLTVSGVRAAAAFAVPDKKTGSRVRLAIEPHDGVAEAELLERVETLLASSLQKNALPNGIDFYTSLPRTRLAKIDHCALQANASVPKERVT